MNLASINFFGTHNFASTVLEKIIQTEQFKIIQVITMPDKPAGRHQEARASAVKRLALENGLTIVQPDSLRQAEFTTLESDLNIVVDYGLIIPKKILQNPKRGSINIHPSNLPAYRGPSPIQSVLLNGEHSTAVSFMIMDEQMDHGPILAQKPVQIDPDDTYIELNLKLAQVASDMFLNVISGYLSGLIKPVPQNDDQATYCARLERQSGLVDFDQPAPKIYNQYRALTPWPGLWVRLNGKRLKLLKIQPATLPLLTGQIKFLKGSVYIGCQTGSIQAMELQMEGKKAVTAESFINGNQKINGCQLDDPLYEKK